MVEYHDDEWGRPVSLDVYLFERLSLEAFQAGLSWSTIDLHKREAFIRAFADFDPDRVRAFDQADRSRLLADATIVRNRAKIEATIGNAAAFAAVAAERGSFASYLAAQLPRSTPVLPHEATRGDVPATTGESDVLSADLRRRRFRFVGSTIAYAFMQSVGLVDDHLPGCHRYQG